MREYLPPAIVGVLLIAGWEIIVNLMDISRWILPAPLEILSALWEQKKLLFEHSLRTLAEAATGLGFATLTGVLTGSIIFHFKILKRAFYPLLVLSQTVPIVILAPLLVIWLGYGVLPKLVVVILACFFPLTVNTVDGLVGTDPGKIALLRSMGADSWQVFKLVRIPSALPVVLSGFRIAATYAVMAAVVAEWMGSDMGLGVYIVRASNSYLTDRVFAGIILVSLYSILFFQAVNLLEKMLVPWQENDHGKENY